MMNEKELKTVKICISVQKWTYLYFYNLFFNRIDAEKIVRVDKNWAWCECGDRKDLDDAYFSREACAKAAIEQLASKIIELAKVQ